MTRRIDLTQEQIAEALRLRQTLKGRYGELGWTRIARVMGIPASRIRSHFEPSYREKKRISGSKWRAAYRRPENTHDVFTITVPDRVWEERDRRLGAPARSLTARIFGDPPIGFAAIDKRRGA